MRAMRIGTMPGIPVLLALMTIGGCATRRPEIAGVAVVPPTPAVARPALPDGMPERLTLPPRDEDGRYRTINSGLDADQAAWHVRSALNVAVLSCRGAGEATIAADYNALLKRQKAVLAKAYDGVQARFRATGAKDWQALQDADATRVYNFFALPPAKPGFCEAATALLLESRTVTPEGFAPFATGALARLEAPFLAVYQRYDAYRRDLASWEAARQPTVLQSTALVPRAAAVIPRLDYIGVDRLMDWVPVESGSERASLPR